MRRKQRFSGCPTAFPCKVGIIHVLSLCALDPPLPTHERYQNSNANFGFRGSCQMRQNGCHPHHYTSAIGIAPVG